MRMALVPSFMASWAFHRADWQYLGTRHDESVAPWPIDSYRCERCDRVWDKVN
jgi:hypothetical protein